MKNPEYLVSHHGADARILTMAEMKRIYQETHYVNLYQKYNQPRSRNKDFPDIAYHVLVGSDGWCYMRDFDIPGYHASNYPVNLNSLAVCISGNYDVDKLSPKMEQYYREAVADLKKNFPSLKFPVPHRKYAPKSCPGKNITDAFIEAVFANPSGKALPVAFSIPDNVPTHDVLMALIPRKDFEPYLKPFLTVAQQLLKDK